MTLDTDDEAKVLRSSVDELDSLVKARSDVALTLDSTKLVLVEMINSRVSVVVDDAVQLLESRS